MNVRLNIGTTLRRDKLTETRRKNVETRRARRSLKCKRHRPIESERKSCYLWESSDLETTTKKKNNRSHAHGWQISRQENRERGIGRHVCRKVFVFAGRKGVCGGGGDSDHGMC